jgi:hypothetical protein
LTTHPDAQVVESGFIVSFKTPPLEHVSKVSVVTPVPASQISATLPVYDDFEQRRPQ